MRIRQWECCRLGVWCEQVVERRLQDSKAGTKDCCLELTAVRFEDWAIGAMELAGPVMVLDYLLQASTVGKQGSDPVLAMVGPWVGLEELAKAAPEVGCLVTVVDGFRAA